MDRIDPLPLPRRRIALLLVVFLAPSGLLTALAVRTLNQERELAMNRQEDERRGVATSVRQEFIAQLERLKTLALSTGADAWHGPSHNASPAILLVARVEDGHLVLPWDRLTASGAIPPPADEGGFAALISRGEAEELVTERPLSAALMYRQALSSARHRSEVAAAELLIARALSKAERTADALSYTRRTLTAPPDLTDEYGVPFALYAARRLADMPSLAVDDNRAALTIVRQVAQDPSAAPSAVHMADTVAADLTLRGPPAVRDAASAAREATSAAVDRTEQALALQQTWPALSRQFPSAASPRGDPLWLPFGTRPWLLALGADVGSGQPLLIAVDAKKAFAQLGSASACVAAGRCRLALASQTGAGEYPFGAALPGLTFTVTGVRGADEPQSGAHRRFSLAAVSLILLLAAFAAYMLWRDVHRELRVAELRSQFVSSVSHELKTPLTAIRMFAETLRMGRPAEPSQRDEYLDTIVNESERLTRLLNNVLDFSRIERGRKTYQFGVNDLSAIVRTAARAMQYPLSQQGFELSVETAGDLPPVRSDPDALEQAILNLLANALKYSGESRQIELRLARDNDHAVISVRDWGIGIAPADQHRIFERFYRASTPENRRIPGTGLGLTLVDHIARAHDGFVDVESRVGVGSTIRMHLPLPLDTEGADGRSARDW